MKRKNIPRNKRRAKQCNLCGKRVEIFFNLGHFPVYVRPVAEKELKKITFLPIKIGFCKSCNHVAQVDYPARAIEEVYKKFYKTFHSTAISGIGSREAVDFAGFINKKISTGRLLEIGCSDGYFLHLMKKAGHQVMGCDPSPKTQIAVKKFKIPVKRKLFDKGLFIKKFDCIVFRHVLEHIENTGKFLKAVSMSLAPNGHVAIEVPNVLYSLKYGVVGSFIHEHISYFTPQSLESHLNKNGYETVFLAEHRNVIYWIGRYSGKKLNSNPVNNADINLSENLINRYINGLERVKKELIQEQRKWRRQGRSIYLYGGGGHTTGLLNSVPLEVKAIIDKDQSKQGKYLAGKKNIPIYPYDYLKNLSERDIVIISSEFFQEEIVRDLRRFLPQGLKIVKLYPHCEYIK